MRVGLSRIAQIWARQRQAMTERLIFFQELHGISVQLSAYHRQDQNAILQLMGVLVKSSGYTLLQATPELSPCRCNDCIRFRFQAPPTAPHHEIHHASSLEEMEVKRSISIELSWSQRGANPRLLLRVYHVVQSCDLSSFSCPPISFADLSPLFSPNA